MVKRGDRSSGNQPLGMPVSRLAGMPMKKGADKIVGKTLGRPIGKSLPKSGSKRPLPSPAPAEALAAPQLEPLAAAKVAWQPTLRWCETEMRETRWMDPGVREAVAQFQTLVLAIQSATDTELFHEAQGNAVAFVGGHPFLRWAPVPSPLPSL